MTIPSELALLGIAVIAILTDHVPTWWSNQSDETREAITGITTAGGIILFSLSVIFTIVFFLQKLENIQ